MKTASLTEGITYNDEKPSITLLLKTDTTKEIRIAFKKGQLMKEHKAPFPIVVEIFEGEIEFGINGEQRILKKGAIIALDAHVPHDLKGLEDAIVRLSISIADKVQRVEDVTNL